MTRLYLFAEGSTEQTFASTVLRPHLAEHGVYMRNPVLIAHAHKKQRTHRGGGRNFHAMQKDIVRFLRQDAAGDAFFTTMIDLYALHRGFPGSEAAQAYRGDPYRRVQMLEESWGEETNDDRFIPHVQLHEYEAYLFSDIAVLSHFYGNQPQAVNRLQMSVGSVHSPEMIDDGPQTAPSKRIISFIPQYEADKVTVGVQAAARIGLPEIRRRCPHFARWLERLEGLASSGSN